MKESLNAKNLVIIGAGDFGRETAAIVERINKTETKWNLMGFIDDNEELQGRMIDDYEVVGDSDWLKEYRDDIWVVCSLGDSSTRKKVVSKFEKKGHIHFATLIDPSVIIMRDVIIEEGSIIAGGTILAVNVRVGRHSIINLNCTIGHDTITGNYFTAHPGSNISGKVVMEDANYFGTGSKVIQGLHITEGCIFGAGSVVIRNIEEAGTYVGNPVKKIK